MNFVETFTTLDKLYTHDTLAEKYNTKLAKILGNAILQTSNPSGQGSKFEDEIAYLQSKDGAKRFGLQPKSFIAVHHIDGQHSNNDIDNLAFLSFKNHSKYHSLRIAIADDWIQENLEKGGKSPFNYEEFDYLARVLQINTYVSACNKLYGEKYPTKYKLLPMLELDKEPLLYIRYLFNTDQQVQQAIFKAATEDNTIKIIPVRDVQTAMQNKPTGQLKNIN